MTMLLSQRLHQLQDDTNKETGFSNAMMDGFRKCIEQAEKYEKKEKSMNEDKLRTQILIGRLSEIVGIKKAFEIAREVSAVAVTA